MHEPIFAQKQSDWLPKFIWKTSATKDVINSHTNDDIKKLAPRLKNTSLDGYGKYALKRERDGR